MNILIIDQCSGTKDFPDSSPVFGPSDIDSNPKQKLLNKPEVANIPAHKLYDGKQQRAIRSAVKLLRNNGHNVTQYYISAGFGVVRETEILPPYEATFSNMSDGEISSRSEKLDIHRRIENILTQGTFDLIFLPLGADYYKSIDLHEILNMVDEPAFGVIFNKEKIAANFANVLSLSGRTAEAKEQGVTVIKLKGQYIKNFSINIAEGGVIEDLDDIAAFCRKTPGTQTDVEDFL